MWVIADERDSISPLYSSQSHWDRMLADAFLFQLWHAILMHLLQTETILNKVAKHCQHFSFIIELCKHLRGTLIFEYGNCNI